MRKPRRSALVTILAGLALAGVVTSSAATLGGARSGALGGARAGTQRITGVSLDWTPVASGSTWAADAVTVTTDSGESFRDGDQVKLAIARRDSSVCELTAAASAGSSVQFKRAALASSCQTLVFGDISSVAVSVTGNALATTFDSNLGEVRGALAAFTGAVVDPDRTLDAKLTTGQVNGVAHVTALSVDVAAAGLTASDLVGARVLARFYHSDTQASFDYSGTASQSSGASIRVTSSGAGSATIAIAIDPVKRADVNRYGIVLSTTQHLGGGRSGGYAISTVAGSITGSGSDGGGGSTTPAAGSALEPIGLDQRLRYNYQEPLNFDGNSLGFCHNFSVTNTSNQPVDWTLTFDTSLVPLWGFDPTASNAFSSSWNWETVSYDATTHRWTIRGTAGMRTVQPGATLGTMGYCVQNVPVPPFDPTSVSYAVSVASSSNQYWVALSLSVTTSSRWNLPWEATIDLADYVCPTGLQGASLQWNSSVEVTKLDATRYTLRGRVGSNTRYVAASRSISISSLLGYSPAGNLYQLPCTKSARTAIARTSEPTAEPAAEPTPADTAKPTAPAETASPETPAVTEEPPVEATPAETAEPATPTPTSAPAKPAESPSAGEPEEAGE